jgi:hypothetical protein
MTAKLVVAYRTMLDARRTVDTSGVVAPANYKDEAKIAAYIADGKAKLLASAASQLYLGTFAEVQIQDAKHGRKGTFVPHEGVKLPLCLLIRNWLLEQYPNAWAHSLQEDHAPEVIFIGFNPRLFVKMLGIECSLLENQPTDAAGHRDVKISNALPLGMWYANHKGVCDLEDMLKPSPQMPWSQVLAARGLLEQFKTWQGPGRDVTEDLDLAVELATQVAILGRDDQTVEPTATA